MATYSRPGVYIEENLSPLPQAPVAPGVAQAAFIGTADRGPTDPTVVNSWSDYVRIFGGLNGGDLAYAVWLFFNNGGTSCRVIRAYSSDATKADVGINDLDGNVDALTFTSKYLGDWGDSIYVTLATPTIVDAARPGRFDLTIKYGGTADSNIVERFADLSLDPLDSRYLVNIVNSPISGSTYVDSAVSGVVVPGEYDAALNAPVFSTDTVLTGGADGVASPGYNAAIDRIDLIDGVVLLNLPGITSTSQIDYANEYGKASGRVFTIVDSPAPGVDAAASLTAIEAFLPGGGTPYDASSYLAVYGPWITVPDPQSSASGATVTLPAGGAVVGRFVTADVSRGTHKPAAGTSLPLLGVVAAGTVFSGTQQDTLFAKGFNLIKAVPGAGFCIWGQRTLGQGTPDRSVAVRRTLLQIRAELHARVQFAVFEPNTPNLWETVENVLDQYLLQVHQDGVLAGDSPRQSYYVVCDASNNTDLTVANGEVHVEVGVALQTPAEFVVITIGQFDGTTVVTEETSDEG
jgi:hypothetical protein